MGKAQRFEYVTPFRRSVLTRIYLSERHPRHIGMPFRLDPQSPKFAGWNSRNAFLQGFTDVVGNHWCGHCFYQCQFINRGVDLGYPELPPSYRIAGYPASGYEGWFALARFGGCVRVETAVRCLFVPPGQQWKAIVYEAKESQPCQ